MNDIYSLLNLNQGVLQDFYLLADRVADHQTEKVVNKNISKLKQIEDIQMADKGIEIAQQSIDEVISKVIHFAPSGNTSMENWTVRELRIVSYYLMKLRDDKNYYKYAIDLLDNNWKSIFFNGLSFYLLNSWNSIEPEYRKLTSQLLVRKLEEYSDSNNRYNIWKNRLNFFEENGPIRMASVLDSKGMKLQQAPTLLGFKETSIKQSYYSDVIIKYISSKGIIDREAIEEILEIHDLDRTKKLLFAYLVEKENKIGDGIRRAQLCRFANSQLGDVTLATSWAPFIGATENDVQKLKRAMKFVNIWFAQQIIESFFEICVQDKSRKDFWMKYAEKVSAFRIVGSTATKRLLQSNSKIGGMFLRYYIETDSYSSQTSALVLFIKNKMIVEFSDTGALYVYNQNHSMVRKVTNVRRRISSTNDLKIPSMNSLVEFDTWKYYFQEEGRMTHQGYWQSRMESWISNMLLSESNQSVSFMDKINDDIFKTRPFQEESFKPKEFSQSDSPNVQRNLFGEVEGIESTFSYRISSKKMENEVRVVANSDGFHLFLGKGHYALIKPLLSNETPTGSIWIKEASLQGWNEIVHNYDENSNRSIGFIRITSNEVIFKENLTTIGKSKYRLY